MNQNAMNFRLSANSTNELDQKMKIINDKRQRYLKQIKSTTEKIDGEDNSDDDMYTKNEKLKKDEVYDIYLYDL